MMLNAHRFWQVGQAEAAATPKRTHHHNTSLLRIQNAACKCSQGKKLVLLPRCNFGKSPQNAPRPFWSWPASSPLLQPVQDSCSFYFLDRTGAFEWKYMVMSATKEKPRNSTKGQGAKQKCETGPGGLSRARIGFHANVEPRQRKVALSWEYLSKPRIFVGYVCCVANFPNQAVPLPSSMKLPKIVHGNAMSQNVQVQWEANTRTLELWLRDIHRGLARGQRHWQYAITHQCYRMPILFSLHESKYYKDISKLYVPTNAEFDCLELTVRYRLWSERSGCALRLGFIFWKTQSHYGSVNPKVCHGFAGTMRQSQNETNCTNENGILHVQKSTTLRNIYWLKYAA